jgi:[ribosomal protein S18]-alanine N-acetyltransferase
MPDGFTVERLMPGDDRLVFEASALFDSPPRPESVARFLADPGHHVLLAYAAGVPVGFVSGVELTHPDKGTEMFLYELAVAAGHRRRGIGGRLVHALGRLARERRCYGMWVLAEADNVGASATYARAGGELESRPAMFSWSFGPDP